MGQPGHWKRALLYLKKTAGGVTLTNPQMATMEAQAVNFLTRNGYPVGSNFLKILFKENSDDSLFAGAIVLSTDIRLREILQDKLQSADEHWDALLVNANTKAWLKAKMEQLDLYWEYR